jgi:hypothetical protein
LIYPIGETQAPPFNNRMMETEMKKSIIMIIVSLILIATFMSCTIQRSIEQTINDFASAATNYDFDLMSDVLSEESDLWAGRPTTIYALLDYFVGQTPVSFSNLDVDSSGNDGTVYADAQYGIVTYENVMFVMRKHDEVWKIKEYYDYVGDPPWAWLRRGLFEYLAR